MQNNVTRSGDSAREPMSWSTPTAAWIGGVSAPTTSPRSVQVWWCASITWRGRSLGERGVFEQLYCPATVFAESEDFDGRPSLPPTYLFNDYLAAYLGAAGTASALRRRAVVGGSWHVRVNLARVCMWVQDLGLLDQGDVAVLPRPSRPNFDLVTVDSPFGPIAEPVLPLAFSDAPTPVGGEPRPLGSLPLQW